MVKTARQRNWCIMFKQLLYLVIIFSSFITMATNQILGDVPKAPVDHLFLFPEKEAWCDVKQIQQEISLPGCQAKLIPNTVCFGQCFSYSIPQAMPDNGGPYKMDPHLQHCDCCKPSRMSNRKVSLKCPHNDVKEVDTFVDVVDECSCQPCAQMVANTDDKTEGAPGSYSFYSYDYEY
ncbi:Neuroblastoma suppressor of tumorigenicity 1 [Holothuria leucospilota]|uniref:Neuroblastoma suppressor of tumorigenicity 1 n=1 Tax=Holothuria leucospilota TaxID=206669 RepID=A0A9Q0YJB9_HOLLE|nr:Neuroblastoma suppressor of tumorigenicity 1 [Holothuria leucospilota]